MANGRLSYVVSLDNTLQDVEDSKAGFNLEELRVILLLCLFFFVYFYLFFSSYYLFSNFLLLLDDGYKHKQISSCLLLIFVLSISNSVLFSSFTPEYEHRNKSIN